MALFLSGWRFFVSPTQELALFFSRGWTVFYLGLSLAFFLRELFDFAFIGNY
jgi:hypothetical protein